MQDLKLPLPVFLQLQIAQLRVQLAQAQLDVAVARIERDFGVRIEPNGSIAPTSAQPAGSDVP